MCEITVDERKLYMNNIRRLDAENDRLRALNADLLAKTREWLDDLRKRVDAFEATCNKARSGNRG